MTAAKTERWLPLTGVFAGLLLLVAILSGDQSPDTSASAAKVAAYYATHDGDMTSATILFAVSGLLILLFAAALRSALTRGERAPAMWSDVAFGGLVVYVAGLFVMASICLSLSELPDHVQPAVVQAVHIVSGGSFVVLAGGSVAAMAGAAGAILRGSDLPRWLGWSALVLAVAGVTPASFFSVVGGLAWIIVASIVIARRARHAAGARNTVERAQEPAPAV